jgi:[ribosomal protein S18]-alanine N-acetyltransferase
MIDLRQARATDLDPLAGLERALFGPEAWSPRSIEQELEMLGPDRLMLVAVDGRRIVGYAALAYADEVADLLRVAVALEYQRRGLASRLCVEGFTVAREHGCSRILLEAAADNTAAISLYARMGFAEIDRRRRYYSGSQDAVVMQLDLARNGGTSQPHPPHDGEPPGEATPTDRRAESDRSKGGK